MSFGSNIQSSELPIEKKNAFVKVFGRLNKYTVLWKWEEEKMEGKPDNLHIRKWLPQKEILCKKSWQLHKLITVVYDLTLTLHQSPHL